jgi:hypothetical protein
MQNVYQFNKQKLVEIRRESMTPKIQTFPQNV